MKEMKVLLVDDEQKFVEALSERLQMRDLNDKEPDVMVLDLKMPGIDGMEVLRRVKKKFPAIRVIILTGHGTDRDEEESRRIGVFDYLKKPTDIEVLVGRIHTKIKLRALWLLLHLRKPVSMKLPVTS
jgi:DNA-binding response OmpR family regulator